MFSNGCFRQGPMGIMENKELPREGGVKSCLRQWTGSYTWAWSRGILPAFPGGGPSPHLPFGISELVCWANSFSFSSWIYKWRAMFGPDRKGLITKSWNENLMLWWDSSLMPFSLGIGMGVFYYEGKWPREQNVVNFIVAHYSLIVSHRGPHIPVLCLSLVVSLPVTEPPHW